MSDKQSSTSFTKQNLKEKQSRINNLLKNSEFLLVWEKGQSVKEKYQCYGFDKDKLQVTLEGDSQSKLLNKPILYSFMLSGVNYFGVGTLQSIQGKLFSLDCSGDLFKSERRSTYRLLTYPHHNVYVQIPVSPEELIKSNVINVQTGFSQTGLFKNFLEIVGGEDQEQLKEGFMRFRVLDLSVTGLAFQVSDLEKKYVDIGKKLNPIFMKFNGEEIAIPSSEVRYVIRMLKRTGKAYKVGVKFLDVDTAIDQFLGKKINDALRDFESEFEDLI